MSKTKKTLAILLAVAMLTSLMTFSALADTWDSVTDTGNTGLTISVSSETEHLNIDVNTDTSISADYVISSTVSGYFPQAFSLQVSNSSATVTGTNGAWFEYDSGTYGLVTMGSGSSILTVTLGTKSCTIYVPAPAYSGETSTSLVAYLPAYGQYTNEGITSGGWGDGYVSGTSGKKSMINNHISTGISLGSFGGYAVFAFANGITNDASHPFGVDFIVYGNAFTNNAEAGCVQVSVDGNTWYDLAGSRHYTDAVWDAYALYTNPTKADDSSSSAPQTGTYYGPNTYTYALDHNGSLAVTHNTFHNHSWYPLYANYFNVRKTGDTELANRTLCEKQSDATDLNNDFLTYAPYDGSTASSVKLTGTRVPFSRDGGAYTFGYFDVHANGSNYGTAYNPYEATASSTGGDGFDLSWAVDGSGRPVSLGTIHYVRLYTGVASMGYASAFGEASAEVTGIYTPTNSGDGEAQNAPTVTLAVETDEDPYSVPVTVTNMGNTPENTIKNVAAQNGDHVVSVTVTDSSADYIYINGVAATSGTSMAVSLTAGSQTIQIICQTGTRSPYITTITLN